ncbi:MAG: hypothetical protein IKR23_01610 [Lachnospiraceae bacterium]|nr:hypothetical protein [Lachnospiraceae bacterium]
MKRKQIMKLLTGISLSVCLMGCSSVGTALPMITKQDTQMDVSEEDVLMEAMEQVIPSHSSTSGKNETVYVLMNADGDASQVIVSDQLKNKDGVQSLNDSTELTDIINVNGYGSYTQNDDGTITWDAQGSDIFYQGTTDKELPLDVMISYELDGVPVSAEELAGKSGHVAICLDYKNNTKETVEVDGTEYEVSVPFAVMSGMMLSNDHFTNVEAENGRVINEGNNQIVVGLAYPGLKESLDWDSVIEHSANEEAKEALEEVSFPESIRIEADVTGFELGMTVTLAGCDLLQQADVEDGIDLSEVQAKMDELSEGAAALADGSCELKNGTHELYSGTEELYSGSTELKDGAGALKDGSSSLCDGIGELKNGSDTLLGGAGSLKEGTTELYNGTNDLKDGSGKLAGGAESLYEGVISYTDGAKNVSDGAEKLSAGAASAKEGADKLNAAIKNSDISGNAAKLSAGAAELSEGLAQLDTGLTSALNDSSSKMQQAETLLNGVCEWMGQTLDGIEAYGAVPAEMLVIPEALAPYDEALKGICGYSAGECLEALSAYNTAHYILVSAPASADAADLAGKYSKCKEIVGTCSGEAKVYAAMIESVGGLAENAATGIASLKQGADQLSDGMNAFSGGISAISDGVDKLDSGLVELSDGASKLSAGAKTLTANNNTLVNGAAALKDGTISLYDGSVRLSDGASRLNSGAGELYEGMAKFSTGAAELNDGAVRLRDGAASLYDGTAKLNDGVYRLNDGAKRLDEGAAELRDGMIRLDEEGVQKISSLLGDNAADVLNRIKAVKKAGEGYRSFTGALEDEEDSVRFIYKTGAISAE